MVKAGHAIQGDMFHERYRQKLVKEFATIKELSGQYGAYATYLSGAGPTVMTLTPNDQAEALKTAIDGLGLDGETFILSVDKAGVVVVFAVEFFDKRKVPVLDRKSTRLNSSHIQKSRMPSSA